MTELHLVMVRYVVDDIPVYCGPAKEARYWFLTAAADHAFLRDASRQACLALDVQLSRPPISVRLIRMTPTIEVVQDFLFPEDG